MHAIQIALELILAPGDSVVIIDPVWPNFGAAAPRDRGKHQAGADESRQ